MKKLCFDLGVILFLLRKLDNKIVISNFADTFELAIKLYDKEVKPSVYDKNVEFYEYLRQKVKKLSSDILNNYNENLLSKKQQKMFITAGFYSFDNDKEF